MLMFKINSPVIFITTLLLFACGLHLMAEISNISPEGTKLRISNSPVEIAKNGKALLPITISPKASKNIRASAAELSAFLKKITGAEFKIEESSKPKGIILGTIAQFPDEEIKKSLIIRKHYDGVEAFAINSDKNCIRLLANTDLGVSHAAFRFLELLGCRWFFMGPTWEIVPKEKNLVFGLNETSRPAMWERNIWFDRLSQRGEKGDPNARIVYKEWRKRNRMAKSFKVSISHCWHKIPKSFKKEFSEHPEYFALTNYKTPDKKLKRKGPQFCVTNPGLQKIVIEYVKQFFKKHPDAEMVSLDPADCAGWCTCEKCRKLGAYSNQPFYLANIVARELAKTHPDKFVGLLAYSWYSDPPAFKLEPNVFVQLTRGLNSSGYTFEQLFKMWTEKCESMSIYEYYSYWEMDKCMLPGTKVTDIRGTARDMRYYTANGVKGISAQASCNWGIHGLGYYMANKLMWNPNADVEALRRDFLNKSFGPAASDMGRYFDRVDRGNSPLPGMGLLRQCLDDLEKASNKVADNSPEQARVDDLRKLLIFSYIGELIDQYKFSNKKDINAEKKLVLDWFTWAYRIRNSYMIAWLSFRSCLGRPAAKKFKDPDLFWRNTKKNPKLNPWRVDKPVTSKELNKRFKELKEVLGKYPDIPEVKYSKDYTLIDSGLPEKNNRPRRMIYSVLAKFLFASIDGKPLCFDVQQRPFSVKRPDAKYILTGMNGKEITSGTLAVGNHKLKLKVPVPGVYHFSCHSRGAGYRIAIPENLPGGLLFERQRRYRPGGYMEPLYFYVPKGTKSIWFYAYNDGTITISNPDDKIVYQDSSNGSYVSVPVPAGQDGKIWKLGDSIRGKGANMRLRRFSFLNLPNVLSFSSKYIFVPSDLAKKDKLKTVINQ